MFWARENGVRITAVENWGLSARVARERAAKARVSEQIEVVETDMRVWMPAEKVDAVLAEGAAYVLTWRGACARAHTMLKPGGYFAATQLCYTPDVEPALREFFDLDSGPQPTVQQAVADLRMAGFEPDEPWRLPREAWTNYFGPIEQRLPRLRREFRGREEALAMLSGMETEIQWQLNRGGWQTAGYWLLSGRRR